MRCSFPGPAGAWEATWGGGTCVLEKDSERLPAVGDSCRGLQRTCKIRVPNQQGSGFKYILRSRETSFQTGNSQGTPFLSSYHPSHPQLQRRWLNKQGRKNWGNPRSRPHTPFSSLPGFEVAAGIRVGKLQTCWEFTLVLSTNWLHWDEQRGFWSDYLAYGLSQISPSMQGRTSSLKQVRTGWRSRGVVSEQREQNCFQASFCQSCYIQGDVRKSRLQWWWAAWEGPRHSTLYPPWVFKAQPQIPPGAVQGGEPHQGKTCKGATCQGKYQVVKALWNSRPVTAE